MTGQVRTVDGRVAGRRGQETRQKLLDCLREMLSTSPYRDVKVIDVARMAGTSPATFYQYFPDVEGAVLEIAEEMAEDSGGLKELVDGKSWAGKTGLATSEELVDGFLAFWRKNDAILRVVTLGAAEGDKRFFKIRMKVLNSVASPLAEAVRNTQGKTDKTVDGSAVAGALVTLLAASAEHSKAFTSWGVKVKDLKPSLALQVYLGVTGKKPPK
ncbi:TetR family transcriptional regulator [Kitasatospora sp. NPDC059795]|uniref:TetR family transcriptional regulator n=1 Tax=unclassified Kitasatospora TaxID=2633591 RepID=UPI00093A5EFD|nr:TetR family transcriptional regulator [Kitasatospora sp. CB01950]OKJ17113.1 TetR family transcriptional regulator [Kitasatospora sp. CB01950]